MRSSTLLLLSFVGLVACGDKDAKETATPVDADTDSDTDVDTDPDTDPDTDTPAGDPVVVVTGSISLAPGETVQLTASTVNGEDPEYTWASSDEGVLTVDEAGLVTGVMDGSATVSATGGATGVSGEIGLYVATTPPYYDAWLGSGHADRTADAFRHWDDDGAVPTYCARCHTKGGYLDYLGADGTDAGSIESDHATNTVIDCETCHNSAAESLTTVTFPSTAEVEMGPEARCATCHQGRSSGEDVDTTISDLGLEESPDTVSGDLGFENIHYYPAAATLYAGEVGGGYEYSGETYDWRFRHVEGYDQCIECHDAHTLEVKVEECGTCHTGVSTVEDLHNIRMIASAGRDYDGDGNTTEGIYDEVRGLRGELLSAIKEYTTDQGLGAICYGETSYPYWFIDTDADGECSETEASYANQWASWTPRLLRATYNYQMGKKDPGNYAHNAKYAIQLMHDALQDINGAMGTPADLSHFDRNDPGHFDGAGRAARYWDSNETVRSSCSKCHSGAEGLHFYLDYGVSTGSVAPDNGLECATCHDDIPAWTLMTVDAVTYPSGIEIEDPGNSSNLCSTCHSGREAKATVDAAIASGSYGFKNVHYAPGGATAAGTDAQVGYEYDGKEYSAGWTTHSGGSECVDCHDAANTDHSFSPADNFDYCTVCHTTATELGDIRNMHFYDVDGDGSSSESLEDELDDIGNAVYEAMRAYDGGTAICYNAARYPYWFADDNDNGTCDEGESTRFAGWDPSLMKAAFNYQMWKKDHGAWAHNFDYMAQLLIDSVDDLGGDTDDFTRPTP